MNYIQLWCLDVDTLYVFNVQIHITVNFNEKYKLKYAEAATTGGKDIFDIQCSKVVFNIQLSREHDYWFYRKRLKDFF